MLESLITSKTRIKLLLKFFLNSKTQSYLRNLETEFGESTNAIRLELNRFEEAGLLCSTTQGNKKLFKANTSHPLYSDIHSLLLKHVGIDQIVKQVITQIGNIDFAFVTGDFASGRDSQVIDVVLAGHIKNRPYMDKLIEKTEKIIHRRIRFLVILPGELENYIKNQPALLIYKADQTI